MLVMVVVVAIMRVGCSGGSCRIGCGHGHGYEEEGSTMMCLRQAEITVDMFTFV